MKKLIALVALSLSLAACVPGDSGNLTVTPTTVTYTPGPVPAQVVEACQVAGAINALDPALLPSFAGKSADEITAAVKAACAVAGGKPVTVSVVVGP